MPVTVVDDPIEVLRAAIYNALDPLTTAGVYWQRATQGIPLPYVIYQSQDLGGSVVNTIGRIDWEGLVTVKGVADSQSAAAALLAVVKPGMFNLAHTGYTFVTRRIRPVVIPPKDDEWQSAYLFRIFINTA